MKALFFGSFNPIHRGHISQIRKLILREYEVELIITPHNPTKTFDDLLPYDIRRELCDVAIKDLIKDLNKSSIKLNINDIENGMDKPNYTYKTLRKLTEIYGKKPCIVMGSDVINNLDTWKMSEEIMTYPIIHLLRLPSYGIKSPIEDKVNIIDRVSTLDEISSSEIRNAMRNGDIDFVKNNMTKTSYILYNRYYNLKKINI